MYLLRLDDACEYADKEKWNRVEEILDKYGVKPLVGLIPACADEELTRYPRDGGFGDTVRRWRAKGWSFALHGFDHVYTTEEGGINPVNPRSEFAGVPLEAQERKIRDGVEALRGCGVEPKIFFAPSHTFDLNTLEALRTQSDIRIISDTVANDIYYKNGFYFIPQQSGRPRALGFKTATFCLHPNVMSDTAFAQLEAFLKENGDRFGSFDALPLKKRKKSLYDRFLSFIYFAKRRLPR